MTTKNLESIMHVGLEGPTKDFEPILLSAIVLWKNAIKLRNLFKNHEKHFIGVAKGPVEGH
jgi:hypothetical protein